MSDIVRTFRAADPRSALDAVKAALGVEAVILETREVGGLWGRPEIEVTAMRSLEEAYRAPVRTPAPQPSVASGNDAGLHTEVGALRRVVDELRSRLANGGAELPSPRESIPSDVVECCRQLMRRGVDNRLAEELVQEAKRALARRDREREVDLEDEVRALTARRLNGARPPWERDERRVIALIGPTGVGKTTTIAKIAARAMLESRLRVAMVTVDTYRIGACEHLGRYGDIMGIKTQVARDAASLATAVKRAGDADLILIDSAGRSDAESISSQLGLLRTVPDIELHLVLSAASGGREIAAAARRYRDAGVNRIIFTKLDEADGPGSVLSATAVVARPVSCVTNGQRVPEDLQPANGSFLLDLVAGPSRQKESLWTKQRA